MSKEACAYITTKDMDTEFFCQISEIAYLKRITVDGVKRFYVAFKSNKLEYEIIEMDYNNLLHVIKEI